MGARGHPNQQASGTEEGWWQGAGPPAWPAGSVPRWGDIQSLTGLSTPAQPALAGMGNPDLRMLGIRQGLTGPGRGRAVDVTASPVLSGILKHRGEQNLQYLENNCFTGLFPAAYIKALLYLLSEPTEFWDPGSYFKPEPTPCVHQGAGNATGKAGYLSAAGATLPSGQAGVRNGGDRWHLSMASWRTRHHLVACYAGTWEVCWFSGAAPTKNTSS